MSDKKFDFNSFFKKQKPVLKVYTYCVDCKFTKNSDDIWFHGDYSKKGLCNECVKDLIDTRFRFLANDAPHKSLHDNTIAEKHKVDYSRFNLNQKREYWDNYLKTLKSGDSFIELCSNRIDIRRSASRLGYKVISKNTEDKGITRFWVVK